MQPTETVSNTFFSTVMSRTLVRAARRVGTGGLVLLVPILVFLRAPTLSAIGVSQAAQIPVATFSTLGNVRFGQVDFFLGTTLGLVAAAGVVIGTSIAHAVPILTLRRTVAVSLVVSGVLIAMRALAAG